MVATKNMGILKPKLSFLDVLEYALCLLLILNITCIWLRTGTGWEYLFLWRASIWGMAFLLVFLRMLKKRITTIYKEAIFYAVFISGCIYFSVLYDFDTIGNATFQVLMPLLSFLFLAYTMQSGEIAALCMKYVQLMVYISVISLFFFITGSVLHLIQPTGTVLFEWGYTQSAATYYQLYYEPQITDVLFLGTTKNCGIFTEGTMYGFLLSIAYMYNRKYSNKRWYKIVLMITILTTLSIMPILSLVLFISINFFFTNQKNKEMQSIKIVLIPIVGTVVLSFFVFMISEKLSTGSFNVRYDHLIGCFKAFIQSFPFGMGYGNLESLFPLFQYEQGLSLGIPYLLALGGIGGAILITYPSINYLYASLKKRDVVSFSFAITFIWIFFCTNILYNSNIQWMILTVVFLREGNLMKRGALVLNGQK